ncbi:SusD family protein [Pedobacter steynii]|uniref:SusD family protein n=1 Tax=Pedobacter steynii TaxID=430522 RepID=A0A1G9K520_9SPHI|nr:RagB/SusD family nutrient uptake outer membrane protein [Pedobacter steynii]NQX38440.1 RagB/SusD family nutrient uptake outer membrane protein [Pedobacter steynii]SDL44465.1 SusD family protein [Pedobacter steynii]
MKPTRFTILLILSVTLNLGCREFLKIDPPTNQVDTEKVYANEETAIAAIRGIYAQMMSGMGFASGWSFSVTVLAGRSSDEFINFNSDSERIQFSTNNISPANSALRTYLWQEPYQMIYAANSVLENLERSGNLSVQLKKQLEGEAKFIRAICHFYLTNLFGEIPYVLSTNYRVNAAMSANTSVQIYTLLIRDLTDAATLLKDDYISGERIRANKWAAIALLSRVYLYNDQWAEAEIEASKIIKEKGLYNLVDDLNGVFLKNSKETILQFVVPVSFGYNTKEGLTFILSAAPTNTDDVSLSPNLLSSFQPGDERLKKWVGVFENPGGSWYYPNKYKVKIGANPVTEYSMVLRLAEQYLIRAEARIMQSKIALGIEDLNSIRERARAIPTQDISDPLPPLSLELNKQDAITAVETERRIELFSEWGHRWLDLKRTDRVDAVLSTLKSPNWERTDALYPIPITELLNASKLKQNPGYQ